MHGLAPECECVSFHERVYLCNSEKKTAGGVDESRRRKAVSPHAALSVETRFFAHASTTLTEHDK